MAPGWLFATSDSALPANAVAIFGKIVVLQQKDNTVCKSLAYSGISKDKEFGKTGSPTNIF